MTLGKTETQFWSGWTLKALVALDYWVLRQVQSRSVEMTVARMDIGSNGSDVQI